MTSQKSKPVRRRKRGRSVDPEVLTAIEALELRGLSAKTIEESLQRDEKLAGMHIPSRRSILNIIKDLQPRDGTEPWSFVSDDGDEVRFVLDVLRDVIQISSGKRRRLSVAEAGLLKRIHQVAPDLGTFATYLTTRRYLAAGAREESTDDLDAYLAFAPWLDHMKAKTGGKARTDESPYSNGVACGWFENRHVSITQYGPVQTVTIDHDNLRSAGGLPVTNGVQTDEQA